MGATQDKMIIKKNGVSMILDASKGEKNIMIFYLKAKRYSLEGQEALNNLPEQKKDTSDKNKNGLRSWAYRMRWTSTWFIGTHIWEKHDCVQHITLSVLS